MLQTSCQLHCQIHFSPEKTNYAVCVNFSLPECRTESWCKDTYLILKKCGKVHMFDTDSRKSEIDEVQGILLGARLSYMLFRNVRIKTTKTLNFTFCFVRVRKLDSHSNGRHGQMCLRTKCWGNYSNQRRRKYPENGETYIMRSFIISIFFTKYWGEEVVKHVFGIRSTHREMRNACKIVVGNLKEKVSVVRPRRWLEDNIKIYLKEIVFEGVDWIQPPQNEVQ